MLNTTKLQKDMAAMKEQSVSAGILFGDIVAMLNQTDEYIDKRLKELADEKKGDISESHWRAINDKELGLCGYKKAYKSVKTLFLT